MRLDIANVASVRFLPNNQNPVTQVPHFGSHHMSRFSGLVNGKLAEDCCTQELERPEERGRLLGFRSSSAGHESP
jgi:hypothetical protein